MMFYSDDKLWRREHTHLSYSTSFYTFQVPNSTEGGERRGEGAVQNGCVFRNHLEELFIPAVLSPATWRRRPTGIVSWRQELSFRQSGAVGVLRRRDKIGRVFFHLESERVADSRFRERARDIGLHRALNCRSNTSDWCSSLSGLNTYLHTFFL